MKNALRKDIKEKLKFHGTEERLEKSFRIMQRLFRLPEFLHARTIAFFAGIQEEVETLPMIEEIMKTGKRIVLPVTDFKAHSMEFAEINDLSELEESAHNLLEPNEDKIVPLSEIDLFIVPGVAFDRKGWRIGKGKGFYDRILQKIDKRIPVIALAFEFQLVEKIPVESHDVKVHLIVTEKRVIKCKEEK